MFNRRIALLAMSAVAFLAACTPPEAQVAPTMTPIPATLAPLPGSLKDLQAHLAQELDVPPEEIVLQAYQRVDWPDACLGVPRQDETCARVVTPGYRAIFSTPLGETEFHTDRSGKVYRQVESGAEPSQASGAPVVVAWERSGGFAGICQRLVVEADGDYWLQDCRKETTLAEGRLSEDDVQHLRGWLEAYGPFTWRSTIPSGAADMFNDQLTFHGTGDQAPSDDEEAAIVDFIVNLVADLTRQARPTETGDG